MNLILLESHELASCSFSSSDNRYKHIVNILKLTSGDTFETGIIEGPVGKARIIALDDRHLEFSVRFSSAPVTVFPLIVVLGLLRPPTTKRLLRDLTSLGVEHIIFTVTDLTEKSYLQGHLWKENSFRKYLVLGAQQSKTTYLPKVSRVRNLNQALEMIEKIPTRLVLDDLIPTGKISNYKKGEGAVLFIGPERGWSEKEREWFQRNNIPGMRLNKRILRSETAAITSVSLMLNKMGFIRF